MKHSSSFTFPKPLEFEVLNKDRVVAKIKLNYANQKVDLWQDRSAPIPHLPFPTKDKVTVSEVLDYFETRCFPRTRHHVDLLLKGLGLTDYIPTEIVKKTHGTMYEDFTWFRFAGEELSFKDVHPRATCER